MVQQELICKHFKSSNPSIQFGLKLQTACQQLMFSTKRWLISSLPLLNTQSKCLNRRQSEVKTITAKEMVKKFSRNIFQTFRCSENALSIRCTAMLKMKSRWRKCAPNFPSHNSLTPGLMIMTCACPQKIVYGFSLMTSSESPQMIFDVIMSRFPQNYSPQIIYDNACKSKEFGLNRETRRFMQIQITCDRFHESNHTSCGKSFKSSEYIQLLGKNTQACEQVNAKLRMIASKCTFMNADMFMRAITLFLATKTSPKLIAENHGQIFRCASIS